MPSVNCNSSSSKNARSYLIYGTMLSKHIIICISQCCFAPHDENRFNFIQLQYTVAKTVTLTFYTQATAVSKYVKGVQCRHTKKQGSNQAACQGRRSSTQSSEIKKTTHMHQFFNYVQGVPLKCSPIKSNLNTTKPHPTQIYLCYIQY